MAAPISPSPVPTVAVPITATAKATPTEVAEVRRRHRATLTRVHAANIMANGTGVREQVWIGIRKYGDTGATWEPFWAPILYDGESAARDFKLRLSELDEVVSYASNASKINVLLEYEESTK